VAEVAVPVEVARGVEKSLSHEQNTWRGFACLSSLWQSSNATSTVLWTSFAEPLDALLEKTRPLSASSEVNESLQHVLDPIQFMKVQSNKRIVSDEAGRELVRHFNRYRLRKEDFQFSNLLGSAYELLINTFAEAAGKKGCELERFDRFIANPPFSQNYTKSNKEFPERFRWCWCPTSGKKGDLMFT